jgi:hypothetical protein
MSGNDKRTVVPVWMLSNAFRKDAATQGEGIPVVKVQEMLAAVPLEFAESTEELFDEVNFELLMEEVKDFTAPSAAPRGAAPRGWDIAFA